MPGIRGDLKGVHGHLEGPADTAHTIVQGSRRAVEGERDGLYAGIAQPGEALRREAFGHGRREGTADAALGGASDESFKVIAPQGIPAGEDDMWHRVAKSGDVVQELEGLRRRQLTGCADRHRGGPAVPACQTAGQRQFPIEEHRSALEEIAIGSQPADAGYAGEVYPMDSGHHTYSEFGPAGVVAAISPWNFPLMMASWKIAPAIAWGNTCIIKPSEDTPASVTLLGRLAVEAGMPPGVLNVLNGHGMPAGAALTGDDRVDRVTFTGSSTTGKHVMASASAHLAPVSLELGGKGANIVFGDADLDNAVYWAVEAIFRNAGQICLAGSRLFIHTSIYDEFMARFVAAAEALTIHALHREPRARAPRGVAAAGRHGMGQLLLHPRPAHAIWRRR